MEEHVIVYTITIEIAFVGFFFFLRFHLWASKRIMLLRRH